MAEERLRLQQEEEEAMIQRDNHLLELVEALVYDYEQIKVAAEDGPRRCRREFLRYEKAARKTFDELASVLRGGEIGEKL